MNIDEHCWTLDKPMASLSTCHLGLWLGWQILLNLVKFSTSGLNKSYPFEREPRMKQYNEINTNTISKIRIYFTDSLGRMLNLNGVQSSVTLSLKAIKTI